MIERMLTGGGLAIGESYKALENGKTITVRSIGPNFQRSSNTSQTGDVASRDQAKGQTHGPKCQPKSPKSSDE